MANKIVPFSRSYDGAEGRFSSVELREPTYKDIFIDGRGEPQMWQPGPNGTAVLITLPEVVDSYVQVLAVNPGAESLGRLGTLDALAVKDAVLGFFRAAETSSAQPTSSSSGSAGTP